MNRKIIILIVIILLLGAGGFFWWRAGAELRELNRGLPEGVRVEKRENQKIIINEIDEYEMKIPEKWEGLKDIEYLVLKREEKEKNVLSSFLFLTASKEEEFMGLDLYESVPEETNLKLWTQEWYIEYQPKFGEKWIEEGKIWTEEETIGDFVVVKLRGAGLEDALSIFFQINSKVYRFWGAPDEIIHEVILNSKW